MLCDIIGWLIFKGTQVKPCLQLERLLCHKNLECYILLELIKKIVKSFINGHICDIVFVRF